MDSSPNPAFPVSSVDGRVRELKQSLSKTLRSVSQGEQVRVTLRGRPVASLVPAVAAAEDDQLRRLVSDGRLVAPAGARPRQAPPLVESETSASSLVLSEREAER
jgi:prevent-host-death family protein